MSSKRLLSRLPSAKVAGVAVLPRHRLEFHKVSSRDGSGKCDVVQSNCDKVFGVLCELEPEEKKTLDKLEGLNCGYDEKRVDVELESGVIVAAITYYATNINPELRPYTWYKRHVLEGAREAGLPLDYIAFIEEIPAVNDPDKNRESYELAIYGYACLNEMRARR